MTALPLSHNSGFAGYWELRRAIWDSNEPLIVKALALAILEFMRPDKLEAYPSRSKLAKMCSISENTLERHWGAITQWVDIIKERGKRNVYRARVYACASELIEMMPEQPPQALGGSLAEAPPRNHPTQRVPPTLSTPQSGEKVPPTLGGHKTQEKTQEKKPPFVPHQHEASGKRWAERDPFGLNPWQAGEHRDVWFDDELRLQVGNGFKLELEAMLGGPDKLRPALNKAATWISSREPPSELKRKVRGQIEIQLGRDKPPQADAQRNLTAQRMAAVRQKHARKVQA